MKQSKIKKLVLGILVLTIAAGVAGGTYAYYVQETRTENVVTTGSIQVEVQETMLNAAAQEVPFQAPDKAMPGLSYSKIVRLTNTGAGEAWVRVKVEVTAAESGKAAYGAESLAGLDYDLTNWTRQGDYWYYNRALKAGETTTPLFTEVSVADSMADSLQGGQLVVAVTGYAVQTANNGASATEAVGWD